MDGAVRVLSVDDEGEFADLVATYLEREDDRFTVETATSADAALERIGEGGLDCVVSDYDMPGRNGIELLEDVREDHPELPFILFTGKGSEAVASDAISAGVTDYLQKSPGTDQFTVLANRVSNAVEHHRTRRRVERGKRRLRRIVDAVPHSLYVVDGDGQYLLANETLAEFHDTTVDAVEESTVREIMGEAGAERFMSDAREVMDSGEPLHLHAVEMEGADGKVHVFEPDILPYDLANTEGRAVLGIATDVTKRVERERRLDGLIDQLEGLHGATRELVAADDAARVADALTDAVADIFEYPHTVVRLREGERLRPAAVSESARDELGDRPTYDLGEGLPGRVYETGEPLVVDDFDEREGEVDRGSHRSALYLPIGDHGTLTIGHPEPAEFDDSDRWLAWILVSNAATVLDRLEEMAAGR